MKSRAFVDELFLLCEKHDCEVEFVEKLSALIYQRGGSEIYLRDKTIRYEYRFLLKQKNITAKKAREALSEKYFTGNKNIERIVYEKK